MLEMNLQLFAERPKKTKNAKREHWIAEYTESGQLEKDYMRLGLGITTIEDNSDEQTEDGGDYAGDGTVTVDVLGISEKWSFSGWLINDDPAQKLIASKKRITGDDRKIWHKIIQTNGEVYEGVATLSGIKTGGGDFSAYEEFACEINYDQTPVKITP